MEGILSSLVLSGLVRMRSWSEGLPPELLKDQNIDGLIHYAGTIGNEGLLKTERWWARLSKIFNLNPEEINHIKSETESKSEPWMKFTMGLLGKDPSLKTTTGASRTTKGVVDKTKTAGAPTEPGKELETPEEPKLSIKQVREKRGKRQRDLTKAIGNMHEVLKQYQDATSKAVAATESLTRYERVIIEADFWKLLKGGLQGLTKNVLDITNPISNYNKSKEMLVRSNNKLTAVIAVKLAYEYRKRREEAGG